MITPERKGIAPNVAGWFGGLSFILAFVALLYGIVQDEPITFLFATACLIVGVILLWWRARM
jgi:hypothetical protein